MNEQLYRVILPIRFSEYKYNYLTAEGIHGMTDFLWMVPKLTEDEIRRLDPRLMALALPVGEERMMDRKNYRVIYKQKYMGQVLQDSYIKYSATMAEMEQAITNLYSDPCVFSAWHEEQEEE